LITLTGGEALLRALLPEEITTVFGVTGGKLSPFMAALAREPRVRYIGARHEGGAALMAAGSVAATGRTAVVIGECGTGAVNLVPGLAVANANSLPLLAITSNNQHWVSYPGRGMFAEMDTESLFRPVTKWTSAVHDGRRIPELVRTALREAHTGRRGAVHLDVPQDVLRGSFEFPDGEFDLAPSQYRLTEGPAATAAQVVAAARALVGATRPLLIAGGGVIQANASPEFRALVELLNAAATATQTGIGAVASDDAHFVGHATITSGPAFGRARDEADVVLAVGCRLSPWVGPERGPLSRTAKLIHVTTDPASLGKNAALEVGILADAKVALTQLLEAVRVLQATPPRREWLERLRGVQAAHATALKALASDTAAPMHPAALAEELAACLPADALITYDGGHTTFWTSDFTPVTAPRTRFNEVGMTQLGFGLPFALALKLAHPGKPVINITGDGAFGFTLQELDTARRYGLPVVTVIHNNAAWGVIKTAHQRGYGFTLGDDLEDTDYAAIARGFGGFGEVVTKREEVRGALERALNSRLPAVLDCRTRFEVHPGLPEFGRMGAVGLPAAPPAGNPAPGR
jgi:acetolactate synthase-1/2/3 large subunit